MPVSFHSLFLSGKQKLEYKESHTTCWLLCLRHGWVPSAPWEKGQVCACLQQEVQTEAGVEDSCHHETVLFPGVHHVVPRRSFTEHTRTEPRHMTGTSWAPPGQPWTG